VIAHPGILDQARARLHPAVEGAPLCCPYAFVHKVAEHSRPRYLVIECTHKLILIYHHLV
jgi:hypothetical protein